MDFFLYGGVSQAGAGAILCDTNPTSHFPAMLRSSSLDLTGQAMKTSRTFKHAALEEVMVFLRHEAAQGRYKPLIPWSQD